MYLITHLYLQETSLLNDDDRRKPSRVADSDSDPCCHSIGWGRYLITIELLTCLRSLTASPDGINAPAVPGVSARVETAYCLPLVRT